MDKPTVSDQANTDDAGQKAEELIEAAAYTPEGRGRLWRLEWAQAFRKLSDFSKRGDNGQEQG